MKKLPSQKYRTSFYYTDKVCPECKKKMKVDRCIRNQVKYWCEKCQETWELDFEDYIGENKQSHFQLPTYL